MKNTNITFKRRESKQRVESFIQWTLVIKNTDIMRFHYNKVMFVVPIMSVNKKFC